MTRRVLTSRATEDGADYVLTGWKAKEVIEATGRGAVWSRKHQGWLLYPQDVPDVVAAAQYRNVSIVGEFPPVSIDLNMQMQVEAPTWRQFDLFGGAA